VKNVRTLGLVAILALALTAFVGVASASAVEFSSESENNYVQGKTGTEMVLSSFQGVQKCKPLSESGVFLSGSFKGKTAASLTLQSTSDHKCNTGTLTMNTCQFILHPGAGTFDIGPETCAPIGLFWFGKYMTIGYQTGMKAKYWNQGSGSSASVLFQKEGLLLYTLWEGTPKTGLKNPQKYSDLYWGGATALLDYADSGYKTQVGLSVK
jgi:hypothetical protein